MSRSCGVVPLANRVVRTRHVARVLTISARSNRSYLARNQWTDLPRDASFRCDSCDADGVVSLSLADILTSQQAPAGGGSLIDWRQP